MKTNRNLRSILIGLLAIAMLMTSAAAFAEAAPTEPVATEAAPAETAASPAPTISDAFARIEALVKGLTGEASATVNESILDMLGQLETALTPAEETVAIEDATSAATIPDGVAAAPIIRGRVVISSKTSHGQTSGCVSGKTGISGLGMLNLDYLQIAADALGMTQVELATKLKDSDITTLLSELTESGELDTLKAAFLTAIKGKLEVVVAMERLTQEQADKLSAAIETALTNWDGTLPTPVVREKHVVTKPVMPGYGWSPNQGGYAPNPYPNSYPNQQYQRPGRGK